MRHFKLLVSYAGLVTTREVLAVDVHHAMMQLRNLSGDSVVLIKVL